MAAMTGSIWLGGPLLRGETISHMRLPTIARQGKCMTPTPMGQTARTFMAATRVDRNEWEDMHREGGMFFDRCHIVDYALSRMTDELRTKVRTWTMAATACADLGE